MTKQHNYVRIDFNNCGLDYDYTICKWIDLEKELNAVEILFADAQYKDFEKYGEPNVELTPSFMTEDEFNKWQESLPENYL